MCKRDMLWNKYSAYQLCDEFDECCREADMTGHDLGCYDCDMFYELAELAEAGDIELRDWQKEEEKRKESERLCGGHFI